MSWFNILKMPFVDRVDTEGGTIENPIVFIDSPNELNGEKFDKKYLTQFRRNTTFFTVEDAELSNYGRVKVNNRIVRPEKSMRSRRLVTKVKGYEGGQYNPRRFMSSPKSRFREGYQPKYIAPDDSEKLRTRSIPYALSYQKLLSINEKIPDNAEIFVNGNMLGTYSRLKDDIEQANEKNQPKAKPEPFQPASLLKPREERQVRRRRIPTTRGGPQ
jgi:hypothetical protein